MLFMGEKLLQISFFKNLSIGSAGTALLPLHGARQYVMAGLWAFSQLHITVEMRPLFASIVSVEVC